MIKKIKNNNKLIYYYTDELNDDFGNIKLCKKDINKFLDNYDYTRGNKFKRFWCDVLYKIVAKGILTLYLFLSGYTVKGKDNYKEFQKYCNENHKGGFIYGNHVNNSDAFKIQVLVLKKRGGVVGLPNTLGFSFIRNITNALGYLPLPLTTKQSINFLKALKVLNSRGEHVVIFPEAHIWPFYTKIRPFIDTSFGYPTKFDAPCLPVVTVFKKRKLLKRPKKVIYVGKMVLPKKELSYSENKTYLRNEIYNQMVELSKENNIEYIIYSKKEEKDLIE